MDDYRRCYDDWLAFVLVNTVILWNVIVNMPTGKMH